MAASGKYAVLDIHDDEMDLQFQDFGNTRTQEEEVEKGTHTHHFTNFPDTHIDDDDDDDEMNNKQQQQQQQQGSVLLSPLSLQYYQTYFNVDSKQVLERLIHSVLPKPGRNYLYMYIRPNPDLYGPFWISLTLSFTTAITGNLANYLMTRPGDVHTWKYDFNKVTLASSAIFAYAWLIPLCVYALLWSRARGGGGGGGGSDKTGVHSGGSPPGPVTLLELICLYGYSLSIFVPVSILWMIPQPWLQWCLAILAPVLSGGVLVRSIWPSLHPSNSTSKHVALGLATLILLLHATLALGFMFYFFQPPPQSRSLLKSPEASTVKPHEALEAIAATAANVEDKIEKKFVAKLGETEWKIGEKVGEKTGEKIGEKTRETGGGKIGETGAVEEVKREATEGKEAPNETTGGNEARKEAIGGNEAPIETTGGNETPKEATGGNEGPKEATGGNEAIEATTVVKRETIGGLTKQTEAHRVTEA